ncbi:SNARE-binding exocyst subunit S6 [Scheffersomyces spartinae]|uniref:SNARE-binding exocyst subunit S6 n=1 Tax=Scheffersomyces spartinae TaxID=45513 RepID=A0A9P8AKV7_9ASCO|nr:SNARE-binding exocyst subunit S6 [Scheffersomyces spartinae]KAG7195484.1 SNARE-binding exocyst subunit S6 [Scheffersomyces spartinae]
MSDPASSRISNLLKTEDDLATLDKFRQEFVKEKENIDKQLSAMTELQISTIQRSFERLNELITKANAVKENLGYLNQTFDSTVKGLPHYDMMRQITHANQYLAQVSNIKDDIYLFKPRIKELDMLIQKEFSEMSQDIMYTAPNLLHIHYCLTQLRNFMDYLEAYLGRLSDDFKSILENIISPGKNVIRTFDDLLNECIISLTEAVKEGNVEIVYKVISLIEFESLEDLKVLIREQLIGNDEYSQSDTAILVDYTKYRWKRRNYRKFFYDRLEASLADTFNKCVDHFQLDRMLVYENLNWLEDELVFVHDSLAPIFPSSWNIAQFIESVYYNKLHRFTMEVINSDPPAEDLMKILAYDSHYSQFVTAIHVENNSKSKDKLASNIQKSIIGEDLKNVVLEDYLKVIVGKMTEWNDNLMNQETITFQLRDQPPDSYSYTQFYEDEDENDQLLTYELVGEVFVLPDFKVPLTMIKEQADVAVESGYSKILVGVLENWSKNYIRRTHNFQRVVGEELEKYMSVYTNQKYLLKESKLKRWFKVKKDDGGEFDIELMTAEEKAEVSKPGIIEYLTALANTYEINTDRLQDKFLPNYLDKVHSSFHTRIEKAFTDTLGPSTDLNAQIITSIVTIVINDLYSTLANVFSKAWYEEDEINGTTLAHRIVETLTEYMAELRGYASYELYLVTWTILLDQFISRYIQFGYENILHGNGKKIDPQATKKYKSFSVAVTRDVTILFVELEHLFTRKDKAYLLSSLRAIEFLGDLGTCEAPLITIPQIWENEVLPAFHNCSIEYIRGVCMCRKDMDKTQVALLITHLERIQERFNQDVEPLEIPTMTLNEFSFS